MKKTVCLLLLLQSVVTVAFAQKKTVKAKKQDSKEQHELASVETIPAKTADIKIFAPTVKETSEQVSGAKQPALTVKIATPKKPNEVEESFRDFIKQYGGKKATKDGFAFVDNASIKEISENTVDLYIKANQLEGRATDMVVAIDLGGIFLSSSNHKDKYKVAENLLKEFAVKATKEPLMEQLKEAQKLETKSVEDQKKLERENKTLQDEIAAYKTKMKTAEDNLAKNKQEQDKNKIEVEKNKKMVADIDNKLRSISTK